MAKKINLGKVGITLEGNYDSSKSYASRTCVFYNHVSWTSKKDVPAGIAPGSNDEYWQKVSERGAQGDRGPQGNSAYINDGEVNKFELVNNLTQGGEAAALSAEQGKILKTEITELESETSRPINVEFNEGGYIAPDGNYGANNPTTNASSRFYKIGKGMRIECNLAINKERGVATVVLYGSEVQGDVLESYTNDNPVIDVTQDCYARFCYNPALTPNPKVVLLNPSVAFLSDKLETNIKETNTNISEIQSVVAENRNALNVFPIEWIDGKSLMFGTGKEFNLANAQCTDYIRVHKGDILKLFINCPGRKNDVSCLYDDNKEYVSAIEIRDIYIDTGYIYNVPSDGYIRLSNDKSYIPNPVVEITRYCGYATLAEVSRKSSEHEESIKGIYTNIITPTWIADSIITNNGILKPDSYVGADARASEFIRVYKGQVVQCNNYSSSSCPNAFYDDNKEFVSSFISRPNNPAIFLVPSDGYIRLTDEANSQGIEVEIKTWFPYVDVRKEKTYIFKDMSESYADNAKQFSYIPSVPSEDFRYKGKVTPKKRYLYCGFDDFRTTDFSWVIPLFEKYGFKATFNRIEYSFEPSIKDRQYMNSIFYGKHELGEHTIQHQMYPFYSPLWDGQNFPKNSYFREDVGGGKNVFGKSLTSNPKTDLGLTPPNITTAWGNLSNEECEILRKYYSLMFDETLYYGKTLIEYYDELSNKYLGTSGKSKDSWNGSQYTGGIFTGCKTSANHEVWERICQALICYYKDVFGNSSEFFTWSLPGSKNGSLYFSDSSNLHYYDAEKTKLANCNARFKSSLTGKERSWTDVLRSYGFNNTHDQAYPSRYDGTMSSVMKHQMIINSDLSRKDGIPYSTELNVIWYQDDYGHQVFTKEFFNSHNTYDKATEMYNYSKGLNNSYYKTIENLRHNSANGILCGSQWDSLDTYQEKIYWEQILRYCKDAGIEVLPKATAMDVAFNHRIESGNLLYNPTFENTAKDFMPDADVPTNPDGYIGDCNVSEEDNVRVLNTNGEVIYTHFGVPVGEIKFSAKVKGNGSITIKRIRNNSRFDLSNLEVIDAIPIQNGEYQNVDSSFEILDYAKTEYEPVFEGLANKVCGIQIVFSAGLSIKNLKMIVA